jgi:hypothetical protein
MYPSLEPEVPVCPMSFLSACIFGGCLSTRCHAGVWVYEDTLATVETGLRRGVKEKQLCSRVRHGDAMNGRWCAVSVVGVGRGLRVEG